MTQPHNLTRYQNVSFVDLKLYLYKIIFKKTQELCFSTGQLRDCGHCSALCSYKGLQRLAQPYGLGQIPETSVQTRGIEIISTLRQHYISYF